MFPRPVRFAQPLQDTLSNAWAARGEWWLLKYAETGRFLTSREKKGKKRGGKRRNKEPVRQACLGVPLPYMETCVKNWKNTSPPMTSSCSVAAAGTVLVPKFM